ncbi:unnamed protein product, partial [Amoebophrya sp. A120]|eukprot:GSA120T00016848001.1
MEQLSLLRKIPVEQKHTSDYNGTKSFRKQEEQSKSSEILAAFAHITRKMVAAINYTAASVRWTLFFAFFLLHVGIGQVSCFQLKKAAAASPSSSSGNQNPQQRGSPGLRPVRESSSHIRFPPLEAEGAGAAASSRDQNIAMLIHNIERMRLSTSNPGHLLHQNAGGTIVGGVGGGLRRAAGAGLRRNERSFGSMNSMSSCIASSGSSSTHAPANLRTGGVLVRGAGVLAHEPIGAPQPAGARQARQSPRRVRQVPRGNYNQAINP